ncbi:DUF2523 domain-containing protein [bacterium AH-315-C08]|nr:DUF2523 domain-containing protein [bacterium AH-315-C08]MBN4079740.1 DUF2523 domain-containing protein [bacterium AH-315-C08]
MGDYFFDFLEFFLDLMMLSAQLGMAVGLEILFLIDGILPDNVNWSSYWAAWPTEIISLANYVGIFECFAIIMTAYTFKFFWKLIF